MNSQQRHLTILVVTLLVAGGASKRLSYPTQQDTVQGILDAAPGVDTGSVHDVQAIDSSGAKTCVVIDVEGRGAITAELDTAKMPVTTANFLDYAKSEFYSGTIFHRVIRGFMIQGGGMAIDMKEKQTNLPIQNEATSEEKNEIGTLAMARTSDPNSASAQFFINVADNKSLDHRDDSNEGMGYAVFGRVLEGMELVNAIAEVETGDQDVPTTPVVIASVKVSTCPASIVTQ